LAATAVPEAQLARRPVPVEVVVLVQEELVVPERPRPLAV